MKITFNNDYSEGAHPKVLEYLMQINNDIFEGYGYDHISERARNTLKDVMKNEGVQIEFMPAGTISNVIGLIAFLQPYHAIISAEIGHINVHEAGSIEATGRKILPVRTDDGKLTVEQVRHVVSIHEDEHQVVPKMVYISNTLENGQVYTKKEIEDISNCCKELDLYLFLDGARIGTALAALNGDLTLHDLTQLTDAFYIGGTKNGMLMGEALVICNDIAKPGVRFLMKQNGAIIAKTWVVAAQLEAMFKDDLYFELAKHANKMANRLQTKLKELGVKLTGEFISNQVFIILDNNVIKNLLESYDFITWEKFDDNSSVIRLVCSWATKEEKVDKFIEDLSNLL